MLTKKRVANKRHLSKNKRALFCNKARFCLIIMTQSDSLFSYLLFDKSFWLRAQRN